MSLADARARRSATAIALVSRRRHRARELERLRDEVLRGLDLLLVGREVARPQRLVGRFEVLCGLSEQLSDGLVDLPPPGSPGPPGPSPPGSTSATAPSSASSSVPPVDTVSPFTTTTNFSSGTAAGWFGTHVRRLHVQERVLDRDHEQVAEEHGGTALTQQRPFGRELRVLVQPREDDAGTGRRSPPTGDRATAALRRYPGSELGRQPGHHVLPALRHERQHELEALLGLTRRLHQQVVRAQPRGGVERGRRRRALGRELAARRVRRDLPLILVLIEDRRVRHVIRRVPRRLHLEQVLRVPEVFVAAPGRRRRCRRRAPGRSRLHTCTIGSSRSA